MSACLSVSVYMHLPGGARKKKARTKSEDPNAQQIPDRSAGGPISLSLTLSLSHSLTIKQEKKHCLWDRCTEPHEGQEETNTDGERQVSFEMKRREWGTKR